MALSTFHLFQRLPIEIRLQVWQLALPNARIIEITYPPMSSGVYLRARCPPPALLAVNAESRGECLKRYSLLKLNPPTTPAADEYIPIDYERDTLFFNFFVGNRHLDMDGWMGALEDDEIERDKIRALAFRFHTYPAHGISEVYWPDNFMCYEWLREFRKLELWIVVLGEDKHPHKGRVKFVQQDTNRTKKILRNVRLQIEAARQRFFDAEWTAPRVKAYRIGRENVKFKPKSRQFCWENLTYVPGGECPCRCNF